MVREKTVQAKKCSVDGCDKPLRALRLCSMHEARKRKGAQRKYIQGSMTNENIRKKIFIKRLVNSSTGCWEWMGQLSSDGYGRMSFNRKLYLAHRMSAKLFLAFDLSSPLKVLHKCDNPRCVNPEHLFIGTVADNMKDKQRKGRQRGTRIGTAKLNEEKVVDIILSMRQGIPNRDIASQYGVTIDCIYKIKIGKNWRHVMV